MRKRCLTRRTRIRPCDGSCLVRWDIKDEIILCADGQHLRFYFCKHERTHVLTTYIPFNQPEDITF